MKILLTLIFCMFLGSAFLVKKDRNMILGSEETVFIGSTKGLEFKAKVDSGAETSSIHATDIQTYESEIFLNGKPQKTLFVHFKTIDDNGKEIIIEKPVSRKAMVRSASGSRERIFIQEKVWIGNRSFNVEVNLADRTHLSKKMLIGKNIIKLGYLIDAQKAFLISARY
jgi:hypothetical protein